MDHDAALRLSGRELPGTCGSPAAEALSDGVRLIPVVGAFVLLLETE